MDELLECCDVTINRVITTHVNLAEQPLCGCKRSVVYESITHKKFMKRLEFFLAIKNIFDQQRAAGRLR
jgi:hypothetical protein